MSHQKTLSRIIAVVVVVGLVATYVLPLLERPRPTASSAVPDFKGPEGSPSVVGPSAPPPSN